MQPFDVVAVGLGTVDFLARVPANGRRGGKTAVKEIVVAGGGPAATAAAVPGALGFTTALHASVGADELGRLMRLQLRQHGVSEALLVEDAVRRTPSAVIEVDGDTAERTVYYSIEGYHAPEPASLPVDAIRQARVVLVDAYAIGLAEAALAAARAHGVPAVLDYEATDAAVARRLIGLAAHVILPAESASTLSQRSEPAEIISALALWTNGQLVITDGARGCWAQVERGVVHHQPAFPVAAIDTTGCGDAFHGAYAVGLLEGWTLAERLEFAAWVAARVAGRLGGRAGIPSRADLRRADLSAVTPSLRLKLEALACDERND